MSTNAELRARARDLLGGGVFSNGWLYAMLISVAVAVITAVPAEIPYT